MVKSFCYLEIYRLEATLSRRKTALEMVKHIQVTDNGDQM